MTVKQLIIELQKLNPECRATIELIYDINGNRTDKPEEECGYAWYTILQIRDWMPEAESPTQVLITAGKLKGTDQYGEMTPQAKKVVDEINRNPDEWLLERPICQT